MIEAMARPLLTVDRLTKHYALTRGAFSRRVGIIRAVEDVSFTVSRGETLGLVGESGSGKTTTAHAILRLTEPTSGTVHFDGVDVGTLDRAPLRKLRQRMQIVFQDPGSVLDPRLPIAVTVGEGLTIHRIAEGAAAAARVRQLLDEVGLPAAIARRYPHECSGGQRQRAGIARALAVDPDFVVCDEPVSALDVSMQAQVINLLRDLQRAHGLTYLFIGHDLALIAHVATRVGVMYFGKLVEIGPTAGVYRDPIMPYTQALLASVPRLDRGLRARGAPLQGAPLQGAPLQGEPPGPAQPPTGCVFHARCPHPAKDAECARIDPPLEEKAPGHWAACLKEPVRHPHSPSRAA
jgi:peptide/nickel transport system ATP-binding protein/oligopeptide transport system ATP-binding protein